MSVKYDTSVNLAGLELDNPIIPASGTFGFGESFSDLYDLDCLGSISIKGTTLNPRYGNELPRIAECDGGMLNAVGLQNPGVHEVCRKELPELAKHFHKPVVANISGFSKEEYIECVRMMDAQENVGILEINISCPNVKHGGMSFGTDPRAAYEITEAVKKVSSKPVFIKLTPNVTDITEIARACEDAGADGLSLINTLLGTRIDIKRRKFILANKTGGVSGGCVFPVAVRMVWQVHNAVNIPIMGMGGVGSCEDVIEMMMAGATAVQIGAENLVNPFVCKEVVEELPRVMGRLGIDKLSDIIGVVD